ncbi:MAG: hypothetical protein WC119_05820 [Synergistaceae bacterium]
MALKGIVDDNTNIRYVFKKYIIDARDDGSTFFTLEFYKYDLKGMEIGIYELDAPGLYGVWTDLLDAYKVLASNLGVIIATQSHDWELGLGGASPNYNPDDMIEWAMNWAVENNILLDLVPMMAPFLSAANKNTIRGWNSFKEFCGYIGKEAEGKILMDHAASIGANIAVLE